MIPEPWLAPYIPEKGSLALDVGFGEGWWAGEFSERFDYVYSFEPDPRNRNKVLPENVFLFPVALSNWSGMVSLVRHANPLLSHQGVDIGEIADRGTEVDTRLVPMMALDDFHLLGVDLIKVDVEGSEVEVLVGARQTIADSHPLLIVEVHSKESGQEIPKLFQSYHFLRVDDPAVPKEIQQRYFWLVGEPR